VGASSVGDQSECVCEMSISMHSSITRPMPLHPTRLPLPRSLPRSPSDSRTVSDTSRQTYKDQRGSTRLAVTYCSAVVASSHDLSSLRRMNRGNRILSPRSPPRWLAEAVYTGESEISAPRISQTCERSAAFPLWPRNAPRSVETTSPGGDLPSRRM
jgi:hypothetical protein